MNPQTRRTFITTLMNVSLCLLAVFVVSFTVFGTTSLASAGLHTKVQMSVLFVDSHVDALCYSFEDGDGNNQW